MSALSYDYDVTFSCSRIKVRNNYCTLEICSTFAAKHNIILVQNNGQSATFMTNSIYIAHTASLFIHRATVLNHEHSFMFSTIL